MNCPERLNTNERRIPQRPLAETGPATELPPTLRYRKSMGFTLKEFFRSLPQALGTDAYRIDEAANVVRLNRGNHILKIAFRQLTERKIGSLSIPRLDVGIELRGYSQAQANRLIDHFELHYLRIGG